MSKLPVSDRIYDDEIDLLSLIQTIWDGKWKIVFIMAFSLLLVFGFNIVKPNITFTARTEIKPITSFEFDQYSLFNSSLKVIEKEEEKKGVKKKIGLNIFEITQKSLLNLYVEEIEERSLLEAGIEKYNLFNKDNFDNEVEYKDAIEKFASEIEVVRPKKKKNETRLYHVLKAEYNDKDKWKKLLIFVNNETNRKVKASIINRFETIVSIQDQKKDFALEDLEIKINNIKSDYDRYAKDRIAFLDEQASIARRLDIKKNTIASERFNAQNTFVTNVKTDTPFYLRGYLAIEEEMKLIASRNDKNAFTKNLYKLERERREIEQDRTIQRAVALFNKTPLNQTDFKATIVKIATTDFETKNKKNLHYALAIVLGSIIGVIYVLLVNAFRNREDNIISS